MLIFYVALAVAGLGQNDKPGKKGNVPAAKTAYNQLDNTLLWKIAGNGLKKPSYLYGTMHVLCADDATLSDSLKLAIKHCDQIYFELDMDNMGELLGAMKYLRMNDGKKLSELLTKEEYAKVEAYFKEHSVPLPLAMMNRFKPYFISSLIGEQMMSCSQKNGMEELIMRESRQYKKEIKGLETTEFQASIFDSIPYEKQAKDLVNYIDSIDSYKEVTMEMVEVYRQQNLERMDSLMHKSDPGMDEYMDILLYGRNRHWVDQMPAIMKDSTILFAVGAGHLPGEQGVINLLRKKGYKVTPMKNISRRTESL
ncbi:TraB/GumN family protein [Longitalea luteola]|uniref:TraB/GumN family protein n=1 Tax=Longitalea luteola TaxID=2812563 RepID=UPI001A96B6F9|nr:TraB/GumN family protein [Longitalea luteola]